MSDLIEEIKEKEKNNLNKYKKLKVIKNLKTHKNYQKISPILKEYLKKQESNYFINPYNISVGKINLNKKYKISKHNLFPNSPHTQNESNQFLRRSITRISSLKNSSKCHTFSNLHSQDHTSKFKSKNSLSSGQTDKQKNSLDLLSNNKIIDNKSLKNYYDDIRKRINEDKRKNKEKEILIKLPLTVRKCLIKQENLFRKNIKEKKAIKLIEDRIKKITKKNNCSELLMNKNKYFDKKNQEYSIIDKNITEENKFKNNLWNITLRNSPVNGKYESIGYLNVGNKYNPFYTFFNINRNIEYFNNPRNKRSPNYRNSKTSDSNRNKLLGSLNEEFYNTKIKQNLKILDSIQDLEITGKNLLDTEDKRESQIKGKKILYNKMILDRIIFKQNKKNKNDSSDNDTKTSIDNLYENKIFARNYTKKDFFKNINLSSKLYNSCE